MAAVTVDRLFRSTTEVELAERKVRVHALSDLELQERHRRALEASMRLGRALKDPNSGEYLSTLEPIVTATRDVLVTVCVNAKRREFVGEAEKEIPYTFLPFPDNATQEEQEQVLHERILQEERLRLDRQKWVEEKLGAYTQSLETVEEEKLRAEALRLTTDLARSAAYSEEFVWQSVLLGTETLDGQPYFTAIEQARHASRPAINRLWDAVEEVTNIDPLASKSPSSTA